MRRMYFAKGSMKVKVQGANSNKRIVIFTYQL